MKAEQYGYRARMEIDGTMYDFGSYKTEQEAKNVIADTRAKWYGEEYRTKRYCKPRKHGAIGTREYTAWASMRQRCKDKNCTGYDNYGGRGISVCKEWEDFNKFLSDMGECPDGYSLDRIDVNGNYSKKNCRWADKNTQARNIRTFNKFGRNGISKTSGGYQVHIGVDNKLVHLGTYKTTEEAITVRVLAELFYWE